MIELSVFTKESHFYYRLYNFNIVSKKRTVRKIAYYFAEAFLMSLRSRELCSWSCDYNPIKDEIARDII